MPTLALLLKQCLQQNVLMVRAHQSNTAKSYAVWQAGDWQLFPEEGQCRRCLPFYSEGWVPQLYYGKYGTPRKCTALSVVTVFVTIHLTSVCDKKPGWNFPEHTSPLWPWALAHSGRFISIWGRNQVNEHPKRPPHQEPLWITNVSSYPEDRWIIDCSQAQTRLLRLGGHWESQQLTISFPSSNAHREGSRD